MDIRLPVITICNEMQDDAGMIPLENKTMNARILDTRNMAYDPNSKYIVSYGGGINSTAMIVFLVKNNFPLDYVIFSDTGDEMPETYDYLKTMERYLSRRNIPFEIVRVRNKDSLSDRCYVDMLFHHRCGDGVHAI